MNDKEALAADLLRAGPIADESVATNLLRGAGFIALELYGDENERRKIYALTDEEKQELGLFYMGKLICGLKSVIRERIAARAAGGAS